MKCERFFFVIVLASALFLFATFGLEAEGGTARTELEKMGYTYTESSFVECAKKGDIEAAKLFLAKGIDINATDEKGNRTHACSRIPTYRSGYFAVGKRS